MKRHDILHESGCHAIIFEDRYQIKTTLYDLDFIGVEFESQSLGGAMQSILARLNKIKKQGYRHAGITFFEVL